MDDKLFIAVLAILMGGVTSAVVTYALNARRSERDFRRQKLEALFTEAHRYCTVIGVAFLHYLGALKGDMSLDDVYKLQIEHSAGKEPTHEQVQMLIEIYFPAVRTAYDELMEARQQLADVTGAFGKAYRRGDVDGRPYLVPYNEALDRLDDAEKHLKRSILSQARRIDRGWWPFQR